MLRFDYTGVGDSAGEFADATVASWCEDVARAAGELAALSGMRELRLVGLRLGAALAVQSLALPLRRSRARVTGVVLWDPVLSGCDFLNTCDCLHSTFVRDAARFPRLARIGGGASPPVLEERLGYRFPQRLRESLLALDLRDGAAWPPVPAHLVVTEASAEAERLRTSLQQLGRKVSYIHLPDAEASWTDYAGHEKPLRAGRLGRAIIDCLQVAPS